MVCKSDLEQGDFVTSYLGELYHRDDPAWMEKEEAYL